MQKTKPKMWKKNLSCLLFFEILIDHIHSKNKKNMLFWVFHFRTKKQQKKTRETKKKSFESKPNILPKVVFFVFLVLLEFFVFPGFVAFLDAAQVVRTSGSRLRPRPKSKICFF
jgi:hypothetical protein